MRTPLLIAAIFLICACSRHNEEDYFKDQGCDTTKIVYEDVSPIFSNNCYICHNQKTNNAGIILDTYEDAKAAAASGLLFKAVNHLPPVIPMPYGQDKLPDCDVNKISRWIHTNSPK
jgi:hypothetical protein